MKLTLKSGELCEILHNDGHLAVQGHSRSKILVTHWEPVCNFLSVN